jgi:hypothetical protein
MAQPPPHPRSSIISGLICAGAAAPRPRLFVAAAALALLLALAALARDAAPWAPAASLRVAPALTSQQNLLQQLQLQVQQSSAVAAAPTPAAPLGAASLEALLFDAGASARLADEAVASAGGDAAAAARRLLLLAHEVRAAARRLRPRIDPQGLLRDYSAQGEAAEAAKSGAKSGSEGEEVGEEKGEEKGEGEEEGDDDISSLGLDPEAPDAALPATTRVACFMQADSSDLCVYENVCIDLPSDETPPRQPRLVFVRREGEVARARARASAQQGGDLAQGAASLISAGSVANLYAAESAERAERRRRRSADPTEAFSAWSAPPPPLPPQQLQSNAQRDAAQDRLDEALERGAEGAPKLDWAFEDVVEEPSRGGSPGLRARSFPFGTSFEVEHVVPEATVPSVLGGAFAGAVTWLPDAYIASNVLNSHLWGFAQSVAFPLFGAAHANASLRLGLPPIRNLIVTAPRDYAQEHVDLAWREGTPWALSDAEAWVTGLLGEALEWVDALGSRAKEIAMADAGAGGGDATEVLRGAPPFVGGEARSRNSEGELQLGAPNGAYLRAEAALGPRLRAAMAGCEAPKGAFRREIGSAMLDGADPLSPTLACLARALAAAPKAPEEGRAVPPFRALLMGNRRRGARLVFTSKDLPDDPVAAFALALARRRLAALGLATPHAGVRDLNRLLLRRPHRVCMRRAVVLGTKELLVGGNAEASLVRAFAAERLGAVPMNSAYRFPPPGILIVDRALDSPSRKAAGPYGRYLDNRPALEKVLRKYGLSYTLVLDRDLYKLPFIEQARLFASHGVLVMAHGAGLVNAHFMSPRSAIVELNAFSVWCPIYSRGLVAAGHHVFALHSKLKGANLDYLYLERPEGAAAREALAARESARCERLGNVAAALDADCWIQLKMASVHVPVAEFEHLLLQALEAVGQPRLPRGSAFALVDGAPSEDEAPVAPLAQLDATFYERRRWAVVRNGTRSGGGGAPVTSHQSPA